MKYFIVYIIAALFLVSCASDRPWYDKTERFKVSSKAQNYFAPEDSDTHYPIDSNLYLRLLDNGSSEFCAMMSAFTMSDVRLERHLPNRCHKQIYKFESCEVSMLDDTINILFRTQNPRRSMASNKMMKIRLLGSEHHTEIIHWGSELQEITHRDGTTSMRSSPTSEVIKTRLKLNKNSYKLGDTIIGEIKVASIQYKGRRKMKVREEAFGKFRAIVGGYDLECDLDESLAHSWVR